MWGWFCIINPFICWSHWDQRSSLPHIVVINLLIRCTDTQFWQTCPSTKHTIPANTTEREGVPGLSWSDTINSASCSRKKASLVLHKNLEDQAVHQAHSHKNWKVRSCSPALSRQEGRQWHRALDAVLLLSINCLLRGRYERWGLGTAEFTTKPCLKNKEPWTFLSLVSEEGLWL